MKKIIYAFIAALLFSHLAYAEHVASAVPGAREAKLLSVVLSQHATIKVLNEHEQQYQLTLVNVNPKVIYFSDRPARTSGQLNLKKFITNWKTGSFKDVPPNALLEAVHRNAENNAKDVNHAIVLTNPVYAADKQQLQFTISPLPGDTVTLTNVQNSDYVALFIDGWCPDCI